MRIVVHVSKFYDWRPVPPDVKVTEKDVKAGRVKPDANGSGYLMRVTRAEKSHTFIGVSEAEIVNRIVFNLMPQNGGIALSRKEAVHELLAKRVMPEHAHPSHMTGFEVHDDAGPDVALFRSIVSRYTTALSDRTGEPLIDPARLDELAAKYAEPATEQDHVDHLHAKFGVRKAVSQ